MNKSPEEILRTEFSEQFVQYMKNRMVASHFKYGSVKGAAKKGIDFLKDVERRVSLYKSTGNTEWLVDAANNLMMEFMFPSVENAHFQATDSAASPGRTMKDGSMSRCHNDSIE